MKKCLIVVLFLLIVVLPGCWIFWIDQPTTADEGEVIDLGVTMHHQLQFSSAETVLDTTKWCVALPDQWETASQVTFAFKNVGSGGTTSATGTAVPSPADSAMLNSGFPVSTGGELSEWDCYALANTVYSASDAWEVNMQVQVGSAGAYTVYHAGFSEEGSGGDIVEKLTVVDGEAGVFGNWSLANGVSDGMKIIPPGFSSPPIIFTSVTQGDGKYIAVGIIAQDPGGSLILSSDDGRTWRVVGDLKGPQTFNVKFSGGMFLFTESSGLLWASPDGEDWSSLDPGIDLYSAARGEGLYVAVGNQGEVAWSSDGLAWTSTNVGGSNYEWFDVAWADDRFVAIGGDDDSVAFMVSPDGMSWTSTVIPGTEEGGSPSRITYGMDKYWAISEDPVVYSSVDGAVWETSPLPGAGDGFVGGLAVGGGYVLVSGFDVVEEAYSGYVYTSPDGDEWTRWSPGTGEALLGAVYADGRFTVVGAGFLIITSDKIGGGGGGGCNTSPVSKDPAWPAVILLVLTMGILLKRKRKT